jgi:hypothetical protein
MPIPFENSGRRMFYGRAKWYLRRCWAPHRCDISGRWLWLVKAYQGQSMTWHYPGSPIVETRWLSRAEFMQFALSGRVN